MIYQYPPFWIPVIGFIVLWGGWGPTGCGKSQEPTPHAVQAPSSDDTSSHIYAGMPIPAGYPNPITRLERTGYVLGYDEIRKNPAWVAYKVPAGDAGKAPKRPHKFVTDNETHAQVTHKDYTHSGYDRGHMAPNYAIATRYGREGQIQTFFMSNIVPQTPKLNRGPWRILEMKVAGRDGLANRLADVWVVTGPIYDADVEMMPKGGVEIPDAFFKIVVDELNGTPRFLAFIMPQEIERKAKPADYLTSVDEVERQTGLDFFAALEDNLEDEIEAETAQGIW